MCVCVCVCVQTRGRLGGSVLRRTQSTPHESCEFARAYACVRVCVLSHTLVLCVRAVHVCVCVCSMGCLAAVYWFTPIIYVRERTVYPFGWLLTSPQYGELSRVSGHVCIGIAQSLFIASMGSHVILQCAESLVCAMAPPIVSVGARRDSKKAR